MNILLFARTLVLSTLMVAGSAAASPAASRAPRPDLSGRMPKPASSFRAPGRPLRPIVLDAGKPHPHHAPPAPCSDCPKAASNPGH
jgi:hypothetical protein